VREQRRTAAVADRVHALGGGGVGAVDLDDAALERDFALVEAEIVDQRAAADRDQHLVRAQHVVALLAVTPTATPLAFISSALYGCSSAPSCPRARTSSPARATSASKPGRSWSFISTTVPLVP
jgi:hypothetical protein